MNEGNPPELAVLDVMMEDKTAGFELARWLHEHYPEMPMIMLTGIRKEMRFGYTFRARRNLAAGQQIFGKACEPAGACGRSGEAAESWSPS